MSSSPIHHHLHSAVEVDDDFIANVSNEKFGDVNGLDLALSIL